MANKPRARTARARERQLIASAYDLAEEQITNKSVSAQVLAYFLKLGSEREKTERKLIEAREQLARAKVVSIEKTEEMAKLYEDAIAAMRNYRRTSDDEELQ